MNYSTMTRRETEIELSTSGSEGLTSFAAHDRLIDNGRNIVGKTYAKSTANILLAQFKNLYTVAYFAMGIITALLDFKGGLWAWVIFFAVAAINMVSGFLRDNKERLAAVDFDHLMTDEVKVIRDGKQCLTDPTLLVKGDVVVLEEGDFVPADLRILSCEHLKVDESIFVGNRVPKSKQCERMEEEVDFLECSNMLFTGTVVKQGRATGAVTAIGKDTVLSKFSGRKSKKIELQNKFSKNAFSEKVLVLGAILCAITVLLYMTITLNDARGALLTSCAVALCLMQAPVAITRLIAVKFFSWRLSLGGVKFSDSDYIYTLAETDYLLFDKGGILTHGEMDLEETLISDSAKLTLAVLCSDVKIDGNKVSGNPIDVATIKEAVTRGFDVKKLFEEHEKVSQMPFDESRKLMAVLVKHNGGYRLIVKGSIDVIPTLCVALSDAEGNVEMSGEVMHKLEKASTEMAEKGLKIRAVAYRDIDFIPENIEDEIKSMIFAGAFGYREVIVKKSKDAVRRIESVFVRPVMVTGDHSITAAAQARLAGLIKKESECISFRELANCTDSELVEAAKKYKVFSSADGEDRERLVKVLSEQGYVTAVAGEQMTGSSVRLYANASVANEEKRECDVSVADENIGQVADVIFSLRAMRGNMAYASLLAISVGVAEALTLLWLMFSTSDFSVTSFDMLLLNLFVVFAPCLILTVFARVKHMTKNRRTLALKCALQAVICALFALLARGNIMMYFVFYSLLDAGRICASFKNLEKGKPGGKGLIAALIVMFVAIAGVNLPILHIFTNDHLASTVAFATLAVIINAIFSCIELKGLGKKHV